MMVEFDSPVEIKGTIQVDTASETNNTLQMADDAFAAHNFQQAYQLYSDFLRKNYGDPYATFRLGLSSAYNSTLAHLNDAELIRSFMNAVSVILKSADSTEVKDKKIFEMAFDINSFVIDFLNLAVNHYNQFSSLQSSAIEYWERIIKLMNLECYALNALPQGALDTNEPNIRVFIRNVEFLYGEIHKALTYESGLDRNGNPKHDPIRSSAKTREIAQEYLTSAYSVQQKLPQETKKRNEIIAIFNKYEGVEDYLKKKIAESEQKYTGKSKSVNPGIVCFGIGGFLSWLLLVSGSLESLPVATILSLLLAGIGLFLIIRGLKYKDVDNEALALKIKYQSLLINANGNVEEIARIYENELNKGNADQ